MKCVSVQLAVLLLLWSGAVAAPSTAAAQTAGAVQMLDENDPVVRLAKPLVERMLAGDRRGAESLLRTLAAEEYAASERFATDLASMMSALDEPGLQIEMFLRGPGGDLIARVVFPTPDRNPIHVALQFRGPEPGRIAGMGRPRLMIGSPPTATGRAEQMDRASRLQVVDSMASLLERTYVDADTGRIIAAHIREQARQGAFEGLAEPQSFAEALTTALRSVNGDRHLGVRSPQQGAAAMPGMSPDGAARAANYYLSRAEVLEGNIGYLRLGPILSGNDAAVERLGTALSFLADTDAIILDLRGVRGGSPAMANAIISHFVEPDVPALRLSDRWTATATVRTSLRTVPGPRRTEVPLYILVDRGSASAGEDVPFVLQNAGRAVIVGEQTAGAGHNNVFVPLPLAFVASVSVGRVQDYATGAEWEVIGVRPDVAVDADAALEAALSHARQRTARATGS
jgi:hypothetical protein